MSVSASHVTDLVNWTRTKTDIDPTLGTPNTDIARVYGSSLPGPSPGRSARPFNLPSHRYIMATEHGSPWIVNDNADGDLAKGWKSLPPSQAKGGVLACPSVRYLPSDGYYYTIR